MCRHFMESLPLSYSAEGDVNSKQIIFEENEILSHAFRNKRIRSILYSDLTLKIAQFIARSRHFSYHQ